MTIKRRNFGSGLTGCMRDTARLILENAVSPLSSLCLFEIFLFFDKFEIFDGDRKMNEEFKDREFEIEGFCPYLDKRKVQLPSVVEIVDVMESLRKNRPVFLGKFPFGLYKFDFCIEEMSDFMGIYGNIPRDWVGLKFELKANPITINKMKGLRLSFRSLG